MPKILQLGPVTNTLAAIDQVRHSRSHNIICLTGPSGAGKTSAALHLVAACEAVYVREAQNHLSHVRLGLLTALGLRTVDGVYKATGRRHETAYDQNHMIQAALVAIPRIWIIDEAGQMSKDTLNTVIRTWADAAPDSTLVLIGESGYGTLPEHDLRRKLESLAALDRRTYYIGAPPVDSYDVTRIAKAAAGGHEVNTEIDDPALLAKIADISGTAANACYNVQYIIDYIQQGGAVADAMPHLRRGRGR